ncbi:MAG: thiamine pyrophosphate-binding protein [Vicinamibacterales bacterium]
MRKSSGNRSCARACDASSAIQAGPFCRLRRDARLPHPPRARPPRARRDAHGRRYARATGEVGVAIATSGPGATNMVTGIATAMMDSSPIVCITGQVGSALIGSDAFQETDITGITLPITKHNYLVTTRRRTWPRRVHEAFYVAKSRRPGPVLIDITKDAQQRKCEFRWPPPVRLPGYRRSDAGQGADLEAAVAMIRAARRPIIFAGNGILVSDATPLVLRFAEHCDIRSTTLGIGSVPASHPLNMGMMGMHGEAWVNTAIQEADLLLALGMRFDDRVTGNLKTYAPRPQDPRRDRPGRDQQEREGRRRARGRRARGARASAAGGRRGRPRRLARPHPCAQGRRGGARHPESARQRPPLRGPRDSRPVAAPTARPSSSPTSASTRCGRRGTRHDRPRTLITSGGLGTMGFALPAAIGAKVARPDAEVWVVVGRRRVQMTMAELATIMQEGIEVKIAIVNNGYLGMVLRQWQEFFTRRRCAATPPRREKSRTS